MYFYGVRGRKTQGPPQAAHTLATPLQRSTVKHLTDALSINLLRNRFVFTTYLKSGWRETKEKSSMGSW